jgi:hypothetical protein
MENKSIISRSWSLKDFKIIEWEKNSQYGKKYQQYSLSKTEYVYSENNGGHPTVRTIFSISLNSKYDLVLMNFLLTERKDGLTLDSYSLERDSDNIQKFFLTKKYQDYKTNEIKEQKAILSLVDILLINELIEETKKDILINKYNSKSNNDSYSEDEKFLAINDLIEKTNKEKSDNKENAVSDLDDTIPF